MNRFIKTTLAVALTAAFLPSVSLAETPTPDVPAATTTNVANAATGVEKAKIEATVHQYLLQKPEVILEALQILQRKQYAQAEQTMKQTQSTASKFSQPLFHDASDPVAGNPTGAVTIVEFFDYQCPHCVDMAPVMDAILKANPNIRVVYKEFPIRGPISEFAARAALAANLQGKYSELSHAILANASQQLTEDKIVELAKTAGLNVDKLKKDMNDAAVNNQIKANMKLGQDLKLFGTPAFFIGKTSGGPINYAPGQLNQSQMQELIDKAK